MEPTAGEIISQEERDILQELMNIAFGNATADLAEVIDIYVKLSVPNIQLVEINALSAYLKDAINSDSKSSIVEQRFWGSFKGSGLLVFPSGSGIDLLALLNEKETDNSDNIPMDLIEKGGLLEISNILIGACVGKFSELLGTFVTYSPPQVFHGNSSECESFIQNFDPSQTAIVMKTVFDFQDKNVGGFLLILTSYESLDWLRKALHDFLDSYE
ncbi:MAG: chemotaxis protein CheC [Deltaproteobacteria bacterium]|nr:chemotaxis protein CheC [Deltaproteobacteria bacterium]MBW2217914.1 chemotaxis protein CheC [Deltaproteobacteria bacterium]